MLDEITENHLNKNRDNADRLGKFLGLGHNPIHFDETEAILAFVNLKPEYSYKLKRIVLRY